MATRPTFEERWEACVQRTETCWLWTGSTHGARPDNQYGRIRYKDRQWKAHRLAYMLHYGEDPGHRLVLHSCDNPLCVNPEHLRLGFWSDNMADSIKRGRNGNQYVQRAAAHKWGLEDNGLS